jgi:ubiquinone/menaquinone biosynthesis C-methylase UbiE
MPTIHQNVEVWNHIHSWNRDGDEWSDQAEFCGQPYDAWKRTLIDELFVPYVTNESHVLEIGPGRGRWTKLYIDLVKQVSLVDVTPRCIEYCRRIFSSYQHVDYFINDGEGLGQIDDGAIDFIWSYDVFVHIERRETKRYFLEFTRVLKDGGIAVIHHPNVEPSLLFFTKVFLVNMTGPLRSLITDRIFARYANKMGRSFVSGQMIRKLAKQSGLQAIVQTDSWGPNREHNCRKFNDQISILRKR